MSESGLTLPPDRSEAEVRAIREELEEAEETLEMWRAAVQRANKHLKDAADATNSAAARVAELRRKLRGEG